MVLHGWVFSPLIILIKVWSYWGLKQPSEEEKRKHTQKAWERRMREKNYNDSFSVDLGDDKEGIEKPEYDA